MTYKFPDFIPNGNPLINDLTISCTPQLFAKYRFYCWGHKFTISSLRVLQMTRQRNSWNRGVITLDAVFELKLKPVLYWRGARLSHSLRMFELVRSFCSIWHKNSCQNRHFRPSFSNFILRASAHFLETPSREIFRIRKLESTLLSQLFEPERSFFSSRPVSLPLLQSFFPSWPVTLRFFAKLIFIIFISAIWI